MIKFRGRGDLEKSLDWLFAAVVGWQYLGSHVYCRALVYLYDPANSAGVDALRYGTYCTGCFNVLREVLLVYCAEGSKAVAVFGIDGTDDIYHNAGNRYNADLGADRIGHYCRHAGFYGGIWLLAVAGEIHGRQSFVGHFGNTRGAVYCL